MWAMLLLLCPALGSAALAPHPTGTLLWSNVWRLAWGETLARLCCFPAVTCCSPCPATVRSPDAVRIILAGCAPPLARWRGASRNWVQARGLSRWAGTNCHLWLLLGPLQATRLMFGCTTSSAARSSGSRMASLSNPKLCPLQFRAQQCCARVHPGGRKARGRPGFWPWRSLPETGLPCCTARWRRTTRPTAAARTTAKRMHASVTGVRGSRNLIAASGSTGSHGR